MVDDRKNAAACAFCAGGVALRFTVCAVYGAFAVAFYTVYCAHSVAMWAVLFAVCAMNEALPVAMMALHAVVAMACVAASLPCCVALWAGYFALFLAGGAILVQYVIML